MTMCVHLCRGNFRARWAAEGGYEPVAEILFNELEIDGYFLEYDDARSGDFAPLRFVPKGKTVVLGLVTTKLGELESKDDLKRRIDEAAKFVPLDQLCAHRRNAASPAPSTATRSRASRRRRSSGSSSRPPGRSGGRPEAAPPRRRPAAIRFDLDQNAGRPPGTMECHSWCSAGRPKSARAAGVPPLFFARPTSSLPGAGGEGVMRASCCRRTHAWWNRPVARSSFPSSAAARRCFFSLPASASRRRSPRPGRSSSSAGSSPP